MFATFVYPNAVGFSITMAGVALIAQAFRRGIAVHQPGVVPSCSLRPKVIHESMGMPLPKS